MVARFLLFVIIFAIVFAFIGKWVYLWVKKIYNKEETLFKEKLTEIEYENKKCQDSKSHILSKVKNRYVCIICGKTKKEIELQEQKENIAFKRG
ncbi:MAG: hypothetical protein ACOCVF_02915 [bacterium]